MNEDINTQTTDLDAQVVAMVRELIFGERELVEDITPYRVHELANVLFDRLGSEYRVRPQMMYNYDRNGLIVKGLKDAKRYTAAQVAEFLARFVSRNVKKA